MLAFLTFLKSPLFKYLMVALAIVGLLLFVYNKGEDHIQTKWDADKVKIAAEIKTLKDKADIITVKTEIKYVDRIKTIKQKGDTIYVKVPEYITTQDNAACSIRSGFVRLWNSAIQNTIPGDPNETDRADAGVSLTEVAANHAINTTACLIYKERAIAWEQWAKEQKENNK